MAQQIWSSANGTPASYAAMVADPSLTGVPALPAGATSPTGVATTPAGANNPIFATLSNVKNPAIDARIQQLLAGFDTLNNASKLGSITADAEAARAAGKPYTDADVANMNNYFNGQVQSQLDTLRNNRRLATQNVVTRSLGDVAKMLKTTQVGGGAGGMSSYLAKLGLDKSADLESQAALDDANQAQKNTDFINQMKLQLSGQRQGALNTQAAGELAPETAASGYYTQLAGLLSGIGQQNQQNTFYGLAKAPAQTL